MQTGKWESFKQEDVTIETRKERLKSFRISKQMQIESAKDEDNSEWEVFRSHSEERNNEIGLYNEGLFPYTLIY